MISTHPTRDDTEQLRLGIIPKDRRIYFWEARGEIHCGYREHYRLRNLKYTRYVPKDVVAKGIAAIQAYATAQVHVWRQEARAAIDRLDAYAAHPNFSVTTTHRGVTLRGRIISATNNTLRVRLEEPYTGERHVEYRWASAMGGHYIFTKTGEFTKDAIASAKRLLAEIYDEAKHRESHRETIALAEQLNRGSRKLS